MQNSNHKTTIENFRSNKAGFTLIELVVVMAIISIISAIITVNFVEVNKRGRDTTRKSDLSSIKTALEIYRSDANTYPPILYSTTCPDSSSLLNGATVYLSKIPCDPQKKEIGYDYVAIPSGCDGVSTACTSYTLTACIENVNDSDDNVVKPYTQNNCASQVGYQVTNP